MQFECKALEEDVTRLKSLFNNLKCFIERFYEMLKYEMDRKGSVYL